jgi:hypothetical protein
MQIPAAPEGMATAPAIVARATRYQARLRRHELFPGK